MMHNSDLLLIDLPSAPLLAILLFGEVFKISFFEDSAY
jgi:hypothetical protein